MITPYTWIMALLDAVGSQPLSSTPRQCPAHRDSAPSLNLHDRDGKLVMKCFAGCTWRNVLASLRVSGSALHEPPSRIDGTIWEPADYARTFCTHIDFPALETGGGHPAALGYRLEAVHDYGGWLLERWRHPNTGKKDLRWHTVTPDGTIPGLHGTPMHELPLYRETEVRAARAMGEIVVVVESESSADALKGWVATTWAGSASSVPVQTLVRVLGGYDRTVYVPDMDDAGLRCASGLKGVEGLKGMRLVIGRIGEDAKDLYRRVGPDGFRAMVMEALGDERDR